MRRLGHLLLHLPTVLRTKGMRDECFHSRFVSERQISEEEGPSALGLPGVSVYALCGLEQYSRGVGIRMVVFLLRSVVYQGSMRSGKRLLPDTFSVSKRAARTSCLYAATLTHLAHLGR